MGAPPMALLPGGHVCGLAAAPEARGMLAAAWVRAGLDGGERVLWVDAPDGPILDWLSAGGVAWAQPLAEGRLVIEQADDILRLRSAADIPDRIALATELTGQALGAGYAGLRIGVESAVALERMPDVATQVRFEEAWEELTRDQPLSLLCLYDPQVYGSEVARAVAGHPRGYADEIVFAALEGERLRVTGEIDLSNVETFGAFAAGAAGDGAVVVDLGGLSFIDARGTSRLVTLSRALAPARLRVASAPPVLRKILDLGDWSGELDLV